MSEVLRREPARLKGFDVGYSYDHGCLLLHGEFHYAGEYGGVQGLGYSVDGDFLARFLGVFRAEAMQQVNGRVAWVTHNNGKVTLIEPLLPEDGEPFDIVAWGERQREKGE